MTGPLRLRVSLGGLTVEHVTTIGLTRGEAIVTFASGGTEVTVYGTITDLRAVAVEIDRQLARLEISARVDDAITEDGAS